MKVLWTFGWYLLVIILLVSATLYPFLSVHQEVAQEEAVIELAPWQIPTRLSALDAPAQKKLLARLTYPDAMPQRDPVPDFSSIRDTAKRKQAFFDYLAPFIDRENARLEKLRHQLLQLQQKHTDSIQLTLEEYAFVYSLFDEFKVDALEVDAAGFTELLLRVDVLPESLVLNQAAKESGWGSSRFAIEGFNFFGQWCFKNGCGFVPSQRSSGKYHEVAKFNDVAASVNAYFYNLNTFYVYDDLRAIRAKARQATEHPNAEQLALGLKKYSERGDAYVTEIQQMIVNNLELVEQS